MRKKILELFRQAKLNDKGPILIYVIFDKKTSYVRVGKITKRLIHRWKHYFSDSLRYDGEKYAISSPFYDAVRECIVLDSKGNIDRESSRELASKCFKRIIIEIQFGAINGRIGEEFWTIYFNRENNDVGFDLKNNKKYNEVVGDYYDFPAGKLHPNYKKINLKELKVLMELGFRSIDAAVFFNVNKSTIQIKWLSA